MSLRAHSLLVAALVISAGLTSSSCDGGETDPCDDVDCAGHGRCVANGTAPACVCDPGYRPVGLDCEPEGGGDGDADSDSDGGDGGGGDADGGLPTGPGPLTFIITSTEFQTARLHDFDGDGDLDNALADLGNPADGTYAALLTSIAASYFDGGWRQCLHVPRVDDRSGPDVASSVLIDFHAFDADDPADPEDDFSGSEPFYAGADSLDGCGEPPSYFEGLRIEDGSVVAGPGTLQVPMFGETQAARRCRVVGSIAPGGASCDIVVSGVVPFSDVGGAQGLETMGDLSRLEAMLAGGASIGIATLPGVGPDVDLDGDGIERFDLDDQGHILRCIDGDRTVIEGRDCWQDPRMADAFSVTVRLAGVSAAYSGRVPGWERLVTGGCDSPPERSLWDGSE